MSLSGRLQLNRYTTGEGKARPPMTCRSDRSPVPPADKRGPERPLGASSRDPVYLGEDDKSLSVEHGDLGGATGLKPCRAIR